MKAENKKPENPFAFSSTANKNSDTEYEQGMTLRDYFAAKTLSGLQSNIGTNRWTAEKYAKTSYEMADAMLKQREL